MARLGEGQIEFANWLVAHELAADAVHPDDIRVHVIRVEDGSRMRYLVRRKRLAELGVKVDLASDT